jgi:hypothetical protein
MVCGNVIYIMFSSYERKCNKETSNINVTDVGEQGYQIALVKYKGYILCYGTDKSIPDEMFVDKNWPFFRSSFPANLGFLFFIVVGCYTL